MHSVMISTAVLQVSGNNTLTYYAAPNLQIVIDHCAADDYTVLMVFGRTLYALAITISTIANVSAAICTGKVTASHVGDSYVIMCFPDLRISFAEPSLQVSEEDGTVEVCIEADTGNFVTPVEVTLTYEDGTAEGADSLVCWFCVMFCLCDVLFLFA